ncbi:MAG: DsbA family protein [Planctomycetes bacterium]|nr:DsbA family protein [Planctomycetota bacterium]
MRVPRSVVVLRLACVAALAASATLTADAMHPGRAFCPLEAACNRAKHSALGAILGIPTSLVGIGAFAALFLATLLPHDLARRVARPAAWLAGAAGLGFVLYQYFVLGSFCPLCLVADLSGLVVAAAAFAWAKAPVRRSKKPVIVEGAVARLRWLALALLAVAVPLLWPAPAARPSWVELPRGTGVDVAAELAAAEPEPAPPPAPVPRPVDPEVVADGAPEPVAEADAVPDLAPPPTAAPPPTSAPPRAETRTPAPVAAPAPSPERAAVTVVEFLNPFCAHCRATHARLERVLARLDVPVRRHRVYVWNTREPPPWARACACAEKHGLGDRLFAALLETDDQDAGSVRAAAQRAGLDPSSLAACGASPEAQARIDRDRRLVASARLEGLPTLDIGRRRLMGEQSEAELEDALRAAIGR